MKLTLVLLSLLILAAPALGQEQVIINEREDWNERMTEFDQEHHDEYVPTALTELKGEVVPQGLARSEYIGMVIELLNELPQYGERQTAQVRPEIPWWILKGHGDFAPNLVAKSRYLEAVKDGTHVADGDIGALYGFYCVYDAEWFNLSRRADYKAWLSALILSYPPEWIELRGESRESLHDRLVAPLQTPDEPYREIDNWIKRFDLSSEAFAKPKVRDALVAELLVRARFKTYDERLTEESAYTMQVPGTLDLSEGEFFLLAALMLEYFQEIYEIDPDTLQPLHFRDYFLEAYGELRE